MSNTAMEINNQELINKIRTDSIMNAVYQMAKHQGMSENEMLIRTVIVLLDLKDEAFQEKVDQLMRNPAPLLVPESVYIKVMKAKL